VNDKQTSNRWRRVPVRIATELDGKETTIRTIIADKPGWFRATVDVNGWPHTYHICAQDELEAMLTLSRMCNKDAYGEDGFFPQVKIDRT
jgi:hypothetical protein